MTDISEPDPANSAPYICPNCGKEIELNRSFCAFCGAHTTASALPPPIAQQPPEPAWPPPNQPGFVPTPQILPEIKILTKSEVGDRVVGTLLGFLGIGLLVFVGLGALIIVPIAVSKYKYLKQGMLIALGVWVLILLGAFGICFYLFASSAMAPRS